MIGIFDSGMGGLTVLRALRDVLPSCDVIYFGDTKNAPYGEKSNEELSLLTVNALKLLKARDADKIISACNSVSASLALSLFDAFDIAPAHMLEMVGPTVAYFKGSNARILLCATPATIRSGIYQNAFAMVGKHIETVAIPALAGAIERGTSGAEVEKIIKDTFALLQVSTFDVLILGCTHYPLVLPLFEKVLPVALFDPAVAVAARAKKLFWPQEVSDGSTTFLISKDSQPFRDMAERLFPGQKFSVEVVQ